MMYIHPPESALPTVLAKWQPDAVRRVLAWVVPSRTCIYMEVTPVMWQLTVHALISASRISSFWHPSFRFPPGSHPHYRHESGFRPSPGQVYPP